MGVPSKLETYLDYQVYLFKYAGRATKNFFTKEGIQLLYPTCTFIATALLYLAYEGWQRVKEHVLEFFFVTVAGQFIGLPILFLFYRIAAPFRVHRKSRKEIAKCQYEKEEQAIQLKELTSSKLSLVSEDRPPYKSLDGKTPDGSIWRFRVHVQNKSAYQLTDCAVILENISVWSGEKFIPRRLKLATDNPPDTLNIPHKQSFSLAPIDGKELIDLCQVDTRPGANRIRIFIATEGHRDLHNNEFYIPKGNYIFTLRAEANKGPSCGASFALEVDKAEPKLTPL